MREWADATWGVVRRDAIVFATYRTQVLTMIVGTLFQLTIFYYIAQLLHARTFATSTAYFAFVVVGMAIMQALVTTLGLTPGQVRQELVAGTMERFLVSPFGAGNGIVAMMVFPTLWSLLMGTIMLALAALVFGLPLVATAPLAVPVALLGALSFMPFTLAVVAVVVVFKQATAGTQFLISGIAIVGGLYFPSALLPGWIRWTRQVQPFSPAADLLRHLLVGSPLQQSVAVDLAKLVGFGLILFPLALLALRSAIRFGQRRGTIIEY